MTTRTQPHTRRRLTPRERLEKAARKRADQTREARAAAMELALEASIVRSEPDLRTRAAWLEARLGLDALAAETLAAGTAATFTGPPPENADCLARIFERTHDFQELHYLDRARRVANAVGRLMEGEVDQGSFFMISRELLITNHHVIPTRTAARRFIAQFGFERNEAGGTRPVTEFRLAPDAFFMTRRDTTMDYTVVALGTRRQGSATLEQIGFCPLPRPGTTHPVGTFVNIIQHPDNEPKQIVLRENWVVCIPGRLLYYTTDTDQGSSGSPVFNDEWKVVGLHHWRGTQGTITLPQSRLALPDRVNEGIRAQVIVDDLRARRGELDTVEKQRMLADAVGP